MSEPTAKANGNLLGWAAAPNGNAPGGTLITASAGAHSYTTHSLSPGEEPWGFRLELPPGTYLVKAELAEGMLTGQQTNVVIKPDRDTVVTITLKASP